MNSRFPAYEITELSNVIIRKLDEITEKCGYNELSGQNSSIIRLLACNKNHDIFQKDIEKKFVVRSSTISISLNLLEQKGYITRTRVENDARLKAISLTKKGENAYIDMQDEITKFHQSVTAGMTAKDLKIFISYIDIIKENLQNFSAPDSNKESEK